VLKGENVLFVCTKKQLKNILQAEAQRCGAFYVTERWLGGTLTNFQTIKKQIKRLKELEQGTAEGEFENYTKKEQLLFDRERVKLDKYLSGIKNMSRLPGALFIVDSKKERIAVAEANKLGIPVVAIVDTNADPELITVPIPGNDDAIRAVSLITAAISDVISEARHQMPLREPSEEGEGVTYSTETGVETEAEGDKKKKPARRKRRPKPEAIAARTRRRPQLQRNRAAEAKARSKHTGRMRSGGQPTAALPAQRREGGVFMRRRRSGDRERDSGQARGRAARPHRRRHDGVQEGAGGNGGQSGEGRRRAAHQGRGQGR